ncbi:preprotein translocase subunit YajC [Thermodesulforhabdus norvegica]|uniref:Sec translocon accessory complex subunit YajC n=1 Tax=Thermodesulforhabdus norvegica TaxID=39841 RepID=A0A1I4UVL2_9BACT|nr:preprotein translocase subunit YajC [Thermodesulforhabdus norvegica]SFM92981.1 protein translocase subunit yajC [Thermodesulforhabdus norvegica]
MGLIGIAYAMGTTGQNAAQGAGGGLAAFVPLILMILIFYFLLIRPQQKRQKEHRQMLANLKKGDHVITQGGLHGTITGLTDSVVTLEIADGVRVKVQRGYIVGVVSPGKDKE